MADLEKLKIPTEEEQNLKAELGDQVSKWLAFRVTSNDTYEQAGTVLTEGVKPALKRAEEFFGPMVKLAHSLHKEVCNRRKLVVDPFKDVERHLKDQMSGWRAALQRIEQQKQAEALRLEREAAAKRQEEAVTRLAEEGKEEEAELAAAAPVESFVGPTTTVSVAAPKAKGVSFTDVFTPEVQDLGALFDWVAEDKKNRLRYLEGNMAELQMRATEVGEGLHIPGVVVRKSQKVSARAR